MKVAETSELMYLWMKRWSPTSRLKSTPPTGAPNATDMPAAAAAERTSLFLAVGT